MSEVTVTTYFKREEQPKENLIVRSVEPPTPGLVLPKGGRFTGLYGTRDTLQLLGDARLRARQEHKNLVRVDMYFDAGVYGNQKQNLANLAGCRVINLFRTNVSLENEILKQIGMSPDDRDLVVEIAKNPQLVNEIFELPLCEEINAIVWGVARKPLDPKGDNREFKGYHRPGAFFQLITLRNTDVIEHLDVRNFDWENLSVEANF